MRFSSVAAVCFPEEGGGTFESDVEGEGGDVERAAVFRREDCCAGCRTIEVKNVSSSRSVGVVMGSTCEDSEEREAADIVDVDDPEARVFLLPRDDELREEEEDEDEEEEDARKDRWRDGCRRDERRASRLARSPSLIWLREMDCSTGSGSRTCIVLLKALRPAVARAAPAAASLVPLDGCHAAPAFAEELAERGRARLPRSIFFGRSVFLSDVDDEDGLIDRLILTAQ